jgi:hypothetical protein
MTGSPSFDMPETESLDPAQHLVQRRRDRDEDDYRAWCEVSYGLVELGPETFHPADVFEKLAPDAARRGRDDAASQARADLEQTVCEQFPAPIAVPFHGFLEGPRSPLTRLHRLRDTWESLVRLLAAVALSEAVAIVPSMAPIALREGKEQGFRECRRRDLHSDKLAIRIGLIEGVLYRADKLSIQLGLASLLPVDVLAEIRRLNAVRNEFSHASTKSDKQATDIIDEVYPALREILLDLREMQAIELFRIKRIVPGDPSPKAEVELLVGHAQSQRIREVDLDTAAASIALSASAVDGMDRVLARLGSRTLDLSPFIYAADDDTGFRTRIFVFKRRKDEEWLMECVGDSTDKSLLAGPHETLLGRFDSLLANIGERGS